MCVTQLWSLLLMLRLFQPCLPTHFFVITSSVFILDIPSFKSLTISLLHKIFLYSEILGNPYWSYLLLTLVVRIRFTLDPFQEFGLKLDISGSVRPPGLWYQHLLTYTALVLAQSFTLFLLMIVVVVWESLAFLFLWAQQLVKITFFCRF